MRLKENAFTQLELLGHSHILISAPMTPHMITAFKVAGKETDETEPADFEFAWSGLQLLCVNTEAINLLVQRGFGPYALEGVGYVSFSKDLFEEWEEDGIDKLRGEDKLRITEVLTQLVGQTMHPTPPEHFLVITQLGSTSLGFPPGVQGFQVHTIVPVSEGAWMGIYQVHTQELKQATEVYKQIKASDGAANEVSIEESLSPGRTLN